MAREIIAFPYRQDEEFTVEARLVAEIMRAHHLQYDLDRLPLPDKNDVREAWRKAKITARYFRSVHEMITSANLVEKIVIGKKSYDSDPYFGALSKTRYAEAQLIRTLAPTKADFKFKQTLANDRNLPISRGEIAAAFMRDEEYLKRRAQKQRCGVIRWKCEGQSPDATSESEDHLKPLK